MEIGFLYLDNGELKVSESAMLINSFKEFHRYDRSTNKKFFKASMKYIFFVYKVFGDPKTKSPLSNLSLHHRKIQAVKYYTGEYKKLEEFENNSYVKSCIQDYLDLERTTSEILFDALKQDIAHFQQVVMKMPIMRTTKVPVEVKTPGAKEGEPGYTHIEYVDIEVDCSKQRFEAIKQAGEMSKVFEKTYKDVQKDDAIKKINARKFEAIDSIKNIVLDEEDIPQSTK